MAEEITGVKPIVDPNSGKPEQQKVEARPEYSGPDPDTGKALDDLLDAHVKEKEAAAPQPDAAPPAAPEPAPPKPDAAPAPAPTPPKQSVEELYPDIQLPQNVKGKSAEQWAALKDRFSADLTKVHAERDELQTKLKEYEAKLQDPIPPELKKEVEDLRAFRARLDIEADPSFQKQFDGKVTQAREFIYSQLKSTGKFGDASIKKIVELGGPENVDWDDLFKQIGNPTVQRLIQSRLDEIEVTKFDKQRALDAAKADVDKYVRERQEAYQKSAGQHNEATISELKPLLGQLKWLSDPPAPKTTATPDEIAVRDAAVKFNSEVRECLDEAVRDDSPSMRAILVAGMAQLLRLRRDHTDLSAAYKKATEQLKEAQEKITKFKGASVSRLRESSAPSEGKPSAKTDIFGTHPTDALDNLRREQLLSRGNA